LPDFTVSSIKVTTGTGKAATKMNLLPTLKNKGKGIGKIGTMKLIIDGRIIGEDNGYANLQIKPGKEKSVKSNLFNGISLAPGTHNVQVEVNSNADQAESVDINNGYTTLVNVAEAPKPDFVLDDIMMLSQNPTSKTALTLSFRIRNMGDVPASPGRLRVSISGLPGPYETIIVKPINKGGTMIVSLPALNKKKYPAGTYYLSAAIDADGATSEKVETNNVRTESFTVRP
jgi:subtilase family serine protease